MMRDYLELGAAPAYETPVQVGTADYALQATAECQRYIALIRRVCGAEPEGALLRVKGFPHDFGTYYEVVVGFDTDDQEAVDYAFRLDSEAPATWDAQPVTVPAGGILHQMAEQYR